MERSIDLVAVDLDGTLLDHGGGVHPRNVEAIRAAREAGLQVVICTGRAFAECIPAFEAIEQTGPVIVSGGAMVADPVARKTLDRMVMEREVVEEAADHLMEIDRAACILKDCHAVGYDYLIVTPHGPGHLDPASKWWFEHMGVKTRWAPFAEDDEHPEHSLRVGAYAANNPIEDIAEHWGKAFAGRGQLQHFRGVLLPKERRDMGIESVHILELFHQQADKFSALQRLAGKMGISMKRVAAIGDQTNDLTMIRGAGLGVAMGNAVAEVVAVSDRKTLHADEGGVGYAIERMLSGEWGEGKEEKR